MKPGTKCDFCRDWGYTMPAVIHIGAHPLCETHAESYVHDLEKRIDDE